MGPATGTLRKELLPPLIVALGGRRLSFVLDLNLLNLAAMRTGKGCLAVFVRKPYDNHSTLCCEWICNF